MSSDVPNKRHGIGLCLSGGGYRAALYHLGAIRRMLELGILGKVRTISSVSGGSIIAAALADRLARGVIPSLADLSLDDWENKFAAPFRKLMARDIRTWPIVQSVAFPCNWFEPGARTLALMKQYKAHLSDLSLLDLPADPLFVFCTTDIVFAVNWEVSTNRVGGWLPGYITPHPNWTVAMTVAASSCFPPVFDAIDLHAKPSQFKGGSAPRTDEHNENIRSLRLCDGGVYDNLGVEPVWKDHEHVLVSDGGKPFQFTSSRWYLGRVRRTIDVQGEQAQKLRLRMLVSNYETDIHHGAYWSIDTKNEGKGHEGYSNKFVAKYLTRVRTDLNRFTKPEMRILENHGYMTASRRLVKRASELVNPDAPPPSWPHPDWQDEELAARAMCLSHRRYSWRRLIRLDG